MSLYRGVLRAGRLGTLTLAVLCGVALLLPGDALLHVSVRTRRHAGTVLCHRGQLVAYHLRVPPQMAIDEVSVWTKGDFRSPGSEGFYYRCRESCAGADAAATQPERNDRQWSEREWSEQASTHGFRPLYPAVAWDRHTSLGATYTRVRVPVAVILALSVVGVAFTNLSPISLYLRQRRRQRLGQCSCCGYDLRAHKSGDRCPECGTVVPPRPEMPPPRSE